jgi:ferric-dicitrate binding protein FerR (iron transport regulator)
MIEHQFWILLARKTTGEITQEEAKELQQLLSAHPEYYLVLEALDGLQAEDRLFFHPGRAGQDYLSDGWHKLRASMAAKQAQESKETSVTEEPVFRERSRFRLWKIAAALAVLVAAGFAMWWHPERSEQLKTSFTFRPPNNNQVSTKNGSRTKIDLPDGSIIWLNGGSKLSYPNGFSAHCRSIRLLGEAYFVIKTDPEHPFLIQTKQLEIRVLGTTFNVRAYGNEGKTVATLINGKVEVRIAGDPNSRIVLKPHEKLTVADPIKGVPGRVEKTLHYEISDIIPDTVAGIPPEEIAWVSNKLVFKNESFREVAFKMERWYDVVFVFKTKSLEKEVLTGAFGKEKLEDALSALALTTPFRYRIRQDTVYLTGRK